MKKWVVGFLFRKGGSEVTLIAKTHPEWQKGKLNGVGGTVDAGEAPLECMRREFLEEAGAQVVEWREFATLRTQGGEVHFFVAHDDRAIKSQTEEEVGWYAVASLPTLPVVPNLAWLIPLALDEEKPNAVVGLTQ